MSEVGRKKRRHSLDFGNDAINSNVVVFLLHLMCLDYFKVKYESTKKQSLVGKSE